MGKTFSDAVAEADYVIDGQIVPGPPGSTGSSAEIRPLRVVKAPAELPLGKSIALTRYVSSAETRSNRRIIFGQRDEGGIDPYRNMLVTDDIVSQYLSEAVPAAATSPKERYAFFFSYLEHPNADVAEDAYKEFAKAPYADVKVAARSYDPAKLRRWLSDPALPGYRIGLYGLLLGLCGRPEDASYLETLMAAEDDRLLFGIDGIFAGYCLLNPKEGMDKVLDAIGDPAAPFKRRYAAIATVRFLLTDFGKADRDEIVRRLIETLVVVDTADLIIDDLRRHAGKESAEAVFALADKPDYQGSVIQRSLLRFALTMDSPAAKSLVQRIEREHPEWIAVERQNLEFERMVQADLENN